MPGAAVARRRPHSLCRHSRLRGPGAARLRRDGRARAARADAARPPGGSRSAPHGVAGQRARAKSSACRSRSPRRCASPPSCRLGAAPGSHGRHRVRAVAAAHSWLEWPRLGCINLHASLLPRWRGAAPIQRAMLAGDDRDGHQRDANGRGARHGARVSRARDADRRRAKPPARCTTGSPCSRRRRLLEALPAVLARHARTRAAARGARDARAEDRQGRGAARLARRRPRSSSGACARSILGPSRRRV